MVKRHARDPRNMSGLIYKARNFAERVHAAQTRNYSGEPYAVHLREVAGYCAEVGCRDEVVAAAWLHDSKEDQGVTDAELRALFGDDVARLVDEVTDQSRPDDGNREARKAIDREHNARASPEGKTIKLADLISNTKSIATRDPHFAVMYLREKRLLMPLLTDGNAELYRRAMALLERYED
jgi:(p)ppGpp synthase/HD superfamily hydrolase